MKDRERGREDRGNRVRGKERQIETVMWEGRQRHKSKNRK